MNANIALPFLSLPDDPVKLDCWMIGRAGGPLLPVQPILDEWDYAADVELRSSISIDMDIASEKLAIPKAELKLVVALKIGTGRGRFPRILQRLSYPLVNSLPDQPVELHAIVPGNTLSGRLHVRIEVLLEAVPENGSVLSPARTGSRLWSEEVSVELEGGGDSRFPIEIVSFTESFPSHRHVTAPWYMSWRPGGLTADFAGSIRLYVNSDHPDLAERVVDGDTLTLQAILGDVMVQIIGAAIDAEDLADQIEDCEEGSVGAQIAGWLDLAFPGRELAEVRNIRRSLPGHFHACIHAAAELGDIE